MVRAAALHPMDGGQHLLKSTTKQASVRASLRLPAAAAMRSGATLPPPPLPTLRSSLGAVWHSSHIIFMPLFQNYVIKLQGKQQRSHPGRTCRKAEVTEAQASVPSGMSTSSSSGLV